MEHDWRAIVQYRLQENEARALVQGYGHPEVDHAPDMPLASGETPAVGDPRVFLGLHNLLRDQTIIVCYKCEEGWTPEIADKECPGEASPDLIAKIGGRLPQEPISNVGASLGGVGRNDPCPCGSGLKFKRCHGTR